MESHDLWVELRPGSPSYMVLRGTYGDKVHRTFHMSRQGVRWRFGRLFNQVYISAYDAILLIETTFGTQLRDHAIRISKERYTLRRDLTFESADRLARQSDQAPRDGDEKA
jgi:hypothetical protein